MGFVYPGYLTLEPSRSPHSSRDEGKTKHSLLRNLQHRAHIVFHVCWLSMSPSCSHDLYVISTEVMATSGVGVVTT